MSVSKRKYNGYLNKELHEQLKNKLYHAKPNGAPWFSSSELQKVLLENKFIDENLTAQKLGAYLTAAKFVKKDFYEKRYWVGKGFDGDHSSKRINKWRVGIWNITAPEKPADIEKTLGISWDMVRDEDVGMYKVILGDCDDAYSYKTGYERYLKPPTNKELAVERKRDYLIGEMIDDDANDSI